MDQPELRQFFTLVVLISRWLTTLCALVHINKNIYFGSLTERFHKLTRALAGILFRIEFFYAQDRKGLPCGCIQLKQNNLREGVFPPLYVNQLAKFCAIITRIVLSATGMKYFDSGGSIGAGHHFDNRSCRDAAADQDGGRAGEERSIDAANEQPEPGRAQQQAVHVTSGRIAA